MISRRWALRASLAAPALMLRPGRARAAYPDRPIRVIVPFAAGGNTDILGRILTQRMAERLGQPMVIENRTGAGGPLTANPVLMARIPYDVERDFMPIGMVGILPMVCQVSTRMPVRNMSEFVTLMRARPGEITIATPGQGSAGHLALELVLAAAQVRAQHVPYRGGSAMIPDLISGTVNAAFVELPSALPLHRDRQAPIIAIATAEPSPLLSGVQTFDQAGFPGFTAGSYGGLLAPANTPPGIFGALQAAFTATMVEPAVLSRVAEVGAIPGSAVQRTAGGFTTFLREELAKARRAAQLAGLQPS